MRGWRGGVTHLALKELECYLYSRKEAPENCPSILVAFVRGEGEDTSYISLG